MINILFKNLYYFFFDIMVSIRSLNKDKNFIVSSDDGYSIK